MKRNFIILFVSIAALFTACVGESPTVIPDPAKQAFTGSETGTSSPQLTGTYPENLDTDIPVDADIVMVFSKPMDAGYLHSDQRNDNRRRYSGNRLWCKYGKRWKGDYH